MNIKLKISSIIKGLGIRANLLGYRYLQCAIELALLEDASYMDRFVSGLYSEVAKRFGTTPANVERERVVTLSN